MLFLFYLFRHLKGCTAFSVCKNSNFILICKFYSMFFPYDVK